MSKIVTIDEEYRTSLKVATAAMCKNSGFESCQEASLETLTEILQSYITELGRSSRAYCEVAGRSKTAFNDIHTALVAMGCKTSELKKEIGKGHVRLGKMTVQPQSSTLPVLQVGSRSKFPTYVSNQIKYPPFPDPHTYMRTLAGHAPESDYSILRETESAQKWNIERALTKFIAKSGSSHPLLPDDKTSYPLIAPNPVAIPYLNALLPSESELRILHVTNTTQSKSNLDKDSPSKKSKTSKNEDKKPPLTATQQSQNVTLDSSLNNVSHNPYLRVVKKPKRHKAK